MTITSDTRLALALEELLRHAPEMNIDPADFPPSMQARIDQFVTATRHSQAITRAATDKATWTPTPTIDHIPGWMRLGLLTALATWMNGHGSTCLHDPRPARPQPVLAAAWKPGLVVCVYCSPLLRVFGDADRRCDCCGRVTRGVEHDDGIRTSTVSCGPFGYQAGVCGDCFTMPEVEVGLR